jgi:hypothetical protein
VEIAVSAKALTLLYEAGIPLLGGLYATLLGFRVVGKKPGADPKFDELHRQKLEWLKWGGPLVMAIGVALGVVELLR